LDHKPTFRTKDVGRSVGIIFQILESWRRYFCADRGAGFATAGSIQHVCDQGSESCNEERCKKIKPKRLFGVIWSS